MVVQVYTHTKPAMTRRALLGAFALLLAASILAFAMTRQRADRPVRVRIEPAGWAISFESPFDRYIENPTRSGYAFSFPGRAPDGTKVVIGVQRIDARTIRDPAVICERAIGDYLHDRSAVFGSLPMIWPDCRLGPLPAVQVWEPGVGAVARAAVTSPTEAYAVILMADRRIDEELFEVFNAACDSVRLRTP